MAITLSTGVSMQVAKTYAASIAVSTLTNASTAVATTASAHSIAVGEFFEITSGWGLLDKRVVRAGAGTTGSTLYLEGINTTDTSKYPAGTGVGSIRKISAWTALSQVKGLSASGGDMQFANVTAIDDVVAKQVPTIRNAVSMNIDVYDDPTLTWYVDVSAASDARSPYGLLMAFPNGSKLVANAYWSLQRVPSVTINEAMTSQISLSYAAEPVRYAS